MKVRINPVILVMAVIVAAIAFLDVGIMANIFNMPLAGIASVSVVNRANPLIIPAAISAGAGIINGISNLFSNKSANKQNVALQRETNALNYQMFKEGNEFNRQMAFDMFNAENEYNSPANQVQRLIDAGLNPALAMENATATSGNGQASAPTAASAPPMMAPSVQPVGSPFASVFQNVEQLASAFQKVNSGNLDAAQKDFVLEQAKTERLKQTQVDIANKIQEAYGMKEADSKVKKLLKDMSDLDSQIALRVQQGKVASAESLLKKMQAFAQKNQNKLFASTFDYLVQQAQEQVNLLRAEVKTEKERAKTEGAKQSNLYSGSALNNQLVNESKSRENLNKQQYDYIKDTQVWTKALLEATAENAQYNLIENKSTILDRIEQVKKLPGLTQASIDELNQRAEALRKSNSVFNQRFALEVLHEITGAFVGYTQGMENATDATKNIVVPFSI